MKFIGDDNDKVTAAQTPTDELKENLTAAVEFHQSAASILAIGSLDTTVKLYKIESQAKIWLFDMYKLRIRFIHYNGIKMDHN